MTTVSAVPTRAPASQPSAEHVSDAFLSLIPRDFARRHLVVSQGGNDETEHLLVSDTTAPTVIHNIGVRLGKSVTTQNGDSARIASIVDEAYGKTTEPSSGNDGDDLASIDVEDDIDRLLADADRDLLSTEGKGPVIQLVDALLFEALNRGASDLHVQPLEDRALVRYRLDGVLHTVRELPVSITPAVISRIKVMGRMDIAERRMPQDGRASVTIGQSNRLDSRIDAKEPNTSGGGRTIDLRISTLPTSYGERAVVRLLDNTQQLCVFDQLGMPDDVAERFLERASRTNGIILVTGPTGSGKTTTLYATLRRIGSSQVNIMTIEDPIEYELATVGLAISQSQVNPRKGVTFATGLRHILRQDPDVVMVGEIRDVETARIAIQSSLTGHLVFSTLHTNDAPSAVTRLIDLGIEPYLVSASLSAILAQRLVRKVHQPCAGEGCNECLQTGFRGRMGVFELLTVDESMRELIANSAAIREIRAAARRGGLRPLAEAGDDLVQAGVTTETEVHRVVAGAV